MSQEELSEPLTSSGPSLVRTHQMLARHHGILVGRFLRTWWMLSQETFQKTPVADIEDCAENRATSSMTGSIPKPQAVIIAGKAC